jgi:hypothetical protein
VASLIVEQPSPVKVGVAAEPRYFFQHAVNAFAGHQAMMVLSEADQADVVLAQQAAPKAACAVIFAPQQTSPWWENVGTPLEAFVPKVQIKDHPALRYLDMSALRFTGARQVKLPIGTVVWVQSDQGVPLVWWGQHAGQSAIVVNMDPAEDSFYLSPYFPVMIQSFASYLAGRQAAPPSTYRPGQRVLLDAPTQTYSPKLEQLGFTTVGPSQKLIACSLLSEVDSLVEMCRSRKMINPSPKARHQRIGLACWRRVCSVLSVCFTIAGRWIDHGTDAYGAPVVVVDPACADGGHCGESGQSRGSEQTHMADLGRRPQGLAVDIVSRAWLGAACAGVVSAVYHHAG